MIKLYPTLIANSVSKNIIPGILKSIERYAMIYRLGDILKQARKDLSIDAKIYKKVGRTKVIVKETEDQLIHFLAKEFLTEQGGRPNLPTGRQRYPGTGSKRMATQADYEEIARRRAAEEEKAERRKEEEETAFAREKGKQRAIPKRGADASVGIGPYDMTSLSLEPSWMKIDMETAEGAKHSGVIGIKAVPIAVKSDAQLHELIMWDKQMGKIMMLIVRLGRPIEGMLYKIYQRTIGKLFGRAEISGNPYRDIVMKRTIIGTKGTDDVFLVLNQADLPPDFSARAAEIQKLFKLSWESFCIADDVNRRVAFCMKQFRGMCSIIPYSMLYQTLGQAKVFEDMEDVRRSSGALFKTRTNIKKMIGESLAQQKLEEFSADIFPTNIFTDQKDIEILHEVEMLNENFATFVKKVASSPKQILSRAMKGTIKVPDIGPERMAVIGRKINKDFKKSYDLAVKVLGNSITELKGKTITKWAAILIVLKAFPGRSKDLLPATREQLIKMIPVIRKGLRKAAQKTSYKMTPPPTHWPEVFIGSVIFMAFVTVGWQFFKAALDMGLFTVAWKATMGTLQLAWSMAVGALNSVKFLIKQFNQDPETAKATAKGMMGEMKEGLEGASETWIILAFAIVGIVATYKFLKSKAKGT